jgi:hypothetical protein
MKKIIITLIIIALLGVGAYLILRGGDEAPEVTPPTSEVMPPPAVEGDPTAMEKEAVLGTSVEGRNITAYHYGEGDDEILFVGGMHGGYSWNTALVAYELMDYLERNPNVIPENVRATVIPVLNPDGLYKIIGKEGRFIASDIPTNADTAPGRFNARNVDLNRNFDCNWKATGTWQNKSVSGGDQAFSEPESRAIRDYIQSAHPRAVLVWYSAAGGVYKSSCNSGTLPETSAIAKVFGDASGYSVHESFDFYEVTGDLVNWLAKQNIPGFSVLLSTHSDTEWGKNRAGVETLLEHYAE